MVYFIHMYVIWCILFNMKFLYHYFADNLHTPTLRIGTHFLLTLETVFLFHLLSTTSKPVSSRSTRLAHAVHLRFFYKNALYKFINLTLHCRTFSASLLVGRDQLLRKYRGTTGLRSLTSAILASYSPPPYSSYDVIMTS